MRPSKSSDLIDLSLINLGSVRSRKYPVYILLLGGLVLWWLACLPELFRGNVSRQFIMPSAALVSAWNVLGRRLRAMRRMRYDRRGQTLLVEQFAWKKLSWQPESCFAHGEIRAIAYGVPYSIAQIWLRPQEGEDILFEESMDPRRAEKFARSLAEQTGLPFVELKK